MAVDAWVGGGHRLLGALLALGGAEVEQAFRMKLGLGLSPEPQWPSPSERDILSASVGMLQPYA